MKTAFRTLTMIGAMSAALLLQNCSEKDPEPDELIVGNWQIASASMTMKVGSQTLLEYLLDQGMAENDAEDFAAIFEDAYASIEGNIDIKKGGTYSSTSGGSTDTGTWELSADGKTLTLDKGTAYAFAFTVSTLTSTSLSLVADESDSDSGFTLSVHIEIALTR